MNFKQEFTSKMVFHLGSGSLIPCFETNITKSDTQLCKCMNFGVKSDNMTKSIICCTSMKKEEIIKATDRPRQQPTQTM
jgi:hypothetical protein